MHAAAPAPPQLCAQERQLARSFVEQYYGTFDRNRAALPSMFRDASTVSFEGDTVMGGNAFAQRLAALGIPANAAHRVITVDAQPSAAGSGAIIVFVTGEFVGRPFGEVFQLVPEPSGAYYVHNLVFRVGDNNRFNVAPGASDVARGFIEYFYSTFDTQRHNIVNLYKPTSFFTTEEDVRQGAEAIAARLQDLPPLQHAAETITADVHQINGNQLLLIFVNGLLRVQDSDNPLFFSETFVLVQEGPGFYIGNHIFKLKYG